MVSQATEQRRRALLRAAHSIIRERYRDPDLDLRAVAAAAGTSPRHLQRVFAELAGEDFRSYLLRVRMQQARRLLTREPNPVPARWVAGRVGYRGASGLRQAFTRYYGYPPSTVQRPPREYLGDWQAPDRAEP